MNFSMRSNPHFNHNLMVQPKTHQSPQHKTVQNMNKGKKLLQVINSIRNQQNKQNPTFIYKRIDKLLRKQDVSNPTPEQIRFVQDLKTLKNTVISGTGVNDNTNYLNHLKNALHTPIP